MNQEKTPGAVTEKSNKCFLIHSISLSPKSVLYKCLPVGISGLCVCACMRASVCVRVVQVCECVCLPACLLTNSNGHSQTNSRLVFLPPVTQLSLLSLRSTLTEISSRKGNHPRNHNDTEKG